MLYTLNAFLKKPHITFSNGPEGKGMSQGWVLEVIATDSTYSSPLQQDLKVLQDKKQDISTGSELESDWLSHVPEQPIWMAPKGLWLHHHRLEGQSCTSIPHSISLLYFTNALRILFSQAVQVLWGFQSLMFFSASIWGTHPPPLQRGLPWSLPGYWACRAPAGRHEPKAGPLQLAEQHSKQPHCPTWEGNAILMSPTAHPSQLVPGFYPTL